MLYRPKFCCECGEKILRKDWKLWTSRRFCEVCEIDKKSYEIFPRIIGVLLLVFGFFGIGNLILRENSGRELRIEKVSIAKKELTGEGLSQSLAKENFGKSSESKNSWQISNSADSSIDRFEKSAQHRNIKTKTEEPIFYCGAETKKGSFCRRRVKGGGRCWQHKGQQALLPSEKLLVVP